MNVGCDVIQLPLPPTLALPRAARNGGDLVNNPFSLHSIAWFLPPRAGKIRIEAMDGLLRYMSYRRLAGHRAFDLLSGRRYSHFAISN